MLSFEVPEGYKFDFEEYLFNTEKHRLTQAKEGWKSFYWLDEKRKLVKASFHVHIDRNMAKSPYRATFGGIDFSPRLSQRHLTEFVKGFESILAEYGVQIFEISSSPQRYDNLLFSKQFQVLVDRRFDISKSELTSIIEVDNNSFESKISNSARLNLRKTHELGFRKYDKKLASEIFEVIEESRKERGYTLSMSKAQILAAAELLSSELIFFGAYIDSKIVGGAICLIISNKIFYAFYVGHLKSFDLMGPTLFLYSKIYEYCQENSFELLDLGTSAENGITKFSLLEFKQSIGAEPSLKLTFSKKLND